MKIFDYGIRRTDARTHGRTTLVVKSLSRLKKNPLKKLEKFHKLGQYYEYFPSFGGQKVVPPYEKKIFSADLHELGHEKKNKKV